MDQQNEEPGRPRFAATGTVPYEEALAGIDDHFVIMDEEYRYVFVNARAAQMVGRRAEELIGHRIWDLFPEAVGNQFHEELHRASAERVSIHSEHYYAPFDRWFVNHIYPFAGGLCVFSTDITELKRDQQERERLYALLETVARQMPAAVIIADAANGGVVFSNEQVSRITGFQLSPGDRIGAGAEHFQLLRPSGRDLAASDWPVMRALEGEVIHNEEILLQRADGTRAMLEASAAPVRGREGQIVAAVVVFQDITQRKRDEETLREADRRKDEFLAMLAHELRNPLAPILHAVHVLRRLEPASPQEAWCQEVIERQTLHLTRLVDDLLDISRITQGKVTLRRQPVELEAIVSRAVETVRPFLEERSHELTMDLSPEPVVVEGDLVRLAQVLSNLLHNAAKYTQDGGRIELSSRQENGHAVLRVRDNGIGIPQEMLTRVFELFMQADRSPARSEGGLGVGLTLVRSLVEMHEGSVEVQSDGPGQGTMMVVRLPVRIDPARVADPTDHPADQRETEGTMPSFSETGPGPAPSSGGRRLLVVDDNRDSAESLALLLELHGHEVQIAFSGPAALETARTFRPEIVLLDIGLPGMDGHEVARELRAGQEDRPLLLVALTGYGQDDDRKRSREAGFDHHLVKPVDLQELARVIARG